MHLYLTFKLWILFTTNTIRQTNTTSNQEQICKTHEVWLSLVTPVTNGPGFNSVHYRDLCCLDLSSAFPIWLTSPYFWPNMVTSMIFRWYSAFEHGSPVNQLTLVSFIDALTHDLHFWMSSNRLCLNLAKTQIIWCGMKQWLCVFSLLRFPRLSLSP